VSEAAERLAQTLGPIDAVEDVEIDGLRRLVHGGSWTVIAGSAARVRAEQAGLSSQHRCAPRWIASSEEAWAIERAEPPGPDALERALGVLVPEGPSTVRAGTLGELLALADPRPDRALVALGVARRHVDRAFTRPLEIDAPIGASLGGALPGWFRRSGDRLVCLSLRRARRDALPLDDLAGLELGGGHELGHLWHDAVALDLSRLRVGLREAVHGAPLARSLAAGFALEAFERLSLREPELVSLRVEAPACLDLARFAPLGTAVPASHARFVARALDGIVIAGQPVRVVTTPPVRVGRARRPFETHSERALRIFGHEAARFDDEGLYSATPVSLAREVVRGLRGVVIDGTAGLGCLAIAAAEQPEVTRVLAVDLEPERLAMARHLAVLRGVASKIEFLVDDVVRIAASRAADALVLDPPWGGRDYERGAVSLGDLALDIRPLLTSFRGALRVKLPRGTRDLPPHLACRAMVDERGAVKFLLASRDDRA
jgi:trimethylguanosine synthase